MTDPAISIQGVSKRFGRYPALTEVNLEIEPGELLALLGPSGSGKTTLLRSIAGLEFPDVGKVLFDGEDVTFARAAARRVGFVFQQYALFPHMSVAKNVAFGLDVRRGAGRPSPAAIARRVAALLKLVELDGLEARYPGQLSGGQRQRVALSRALAAEPRVLLLDEPFGALDATVRKSLRRELRRIHETTGVTTVFVTHDQEEALELADRVAILNEGGIEQVGSPGEVYENPTSAFVCGFLGEANRFEGSVVDGRFTAGAVSLSARDVADGPATAYVRPHDVALAEAGLQMTVRRVSAQGAVARVEGELADGRAIEAVLPKGDGGEPGRGATLMLEVKRAHIYSAGQGRRRE